MKKLILASQSPRRKQLLQDAGIDFEIKTVSIKELFPDDLEIEKVPLFLAKKKANAVWNTLSVVEKQNEVILSSDTVVVFQNKIFGKPKDERDAFEMLSALSGRIHQVITAAVLFYKDGIIEISESTDVHFKQLSEDQINYYIHQFKPFDKAGAYGIQEWIGLVGIEKIVGDFYSVMGLPVNKVVEAWNKIKKD